MAENNLLLQTQPDLVLRNTSRRVLVPQPPSKVSFGLVFGIAVVTSVIGGGVLGGLTGGFVGGLAGVALGFAFGALASIIVYAYLKKKERDAAVLSTRDSHAYMASQMEVSPELGNVNRPQVELTETSSYAVLFEPEPAQSIVPAATNTAVAEIETATITP